MGSDTLQYFIIATAMSTLLFAIFFLVLSVHMERYYMRLWGITLFGYGLGYVIEFFMFSFRSDPLYLSFHILLLIICAGFFFAGACNFFSLKQPPFIIWIFIISILLSIACMASPVLHALFMVPLILFAALILFSTGILFTLCAWTPRVTEKYLASFIIIFWGVYNSNLPFRADYLPVVVTNHAIGLILLNTMVILLLIIHFKKVRFLITRQEAHYRMLVENAAGAMLLYDFSKKKFQYVSPSALEETGHSASELIEDPWALLHGIPVDSAEEIRDLLRTPRVQPASLIYSRETEEGLTRWYELHATPVLDNASFPVGVECVISNITPRMELLEDLKRSEEARRELIEDISHELRTPITIIQGYAETLLQESPPEANTVYLETIHAKTRSLNNLLEDLIQSSDFSSRRIEYKFYEIAAGTYFDRAFEENRLQLTQAGRIFHYENAIPPDVVIIVDRNRIDQVISNLLSNALKFTKTGDVISVICKEKGEPDAGRVLLRVSDMGPGIPVENLQSIFNRKFSRENPQGDKGFGLGLYISKEIVLEHGGQIWAENNPGGGASFYVSLPSMVSGSRVMNL